MTATTYAVVGAMNKIPLLLLGAFLFANVITTQQWLYISVSMVSVSVLCSPPSLPPSLPLPP